MALADLVGHDMACQPVSFCGCASSGTEAPLQARHRPEEKGSDLRKMFLGGLLSPTIQQINRKIT